MSRIVDRTVPYSIPEWKAWLGLHGVNIDDTVSVSLDGPLAIATVYRDSPRVLVDEEIPVDLVRFKIRSAPPAPSAGEISFGMTEEEARFFLAGAGLD